MLCPYCSTTATGDTASAALPVNRVPNEQGAVSSQLPGPSPANVPESENGASAVLRTLHTITARVGHAVTRLWSLLRVCGSRAWTLALKLASFSRRNAAAAALAIKRFLGVQHGEPPILVGKLQSGSLVPMQRSDRPVWARIVRLIAWLPAAAAVILGAFIWWTIRPMLFMFRLMSGSLFAGSLLRGLMIGTVAGFAGASVANRIRGQQQVHLWEVTDSTGARGVVRVALPEDHGYDLLPGDELEVWGRRAGDGSVRASIVVNRRNAARLTPPFVSFSRWFFFAFGMALLAVAAVNLVGGAL